MSSSSLPTSTSPSPHSSSHRQLSSLTQQIAEVQEEIKEVKKEIKETNIRLESCNPEDKPWFRKQVEQLRDKENKLLDKETELSKKENLLLQQQQQQASVTAASTSQESLQDRIDNKRHELYRCINAAEKLDDALKDPHLSAEERESKQKQRDGIVTVIASLKTELEDLSGEQQAKRHRSSFTVTLPGERVTEVELWKAEVIEKKVPREIVDVDSLLAVPRPLVTELRWLQLKIDSVHNRLDVVKNMRAAREPNQRDLEVPYHGLLLQFFRAASLGQNGLEFLGEDFNASKPREDIRGMINGVRKEPQECKTECVYNPAPEQRSPMAIDANSEPLGKLLQVCRSACLDAGQPCVRLCTFVGRIEYVWFVEFRFAADGRLERCRVAPFFPSKGQSMAVNVLCPLPAHRIAASNTLADLLDPAPTTGFQLLSRYVDQLAAIHSLPITPLQLRTANGQLIDLSQAQVVARGHHSLILLLSPASTSVIKISARRLIEHERGIHAIVDGCSPYLRTMVAGPTGYGVVEGVGDGLAFLLLDGFGQPLQAVDAADDATFASLWEQAAAGLTALHRKRVLHRDVKPSNMILLHGQLLLNDFDICCSMDDAVATGQLMVGTPDYHSPKLAGKWRERDDWLGLVIAFLSLRMPFPFGNKQAALEQALTVPWAPSSLKDAIRKSYK